MYILNPVVLFAVISLQVAIALQPRVIVAEHQVVFSADFIGIGILDFAGVLVDPLEGIWFSCNLMCY